MDAGALPQVQRGEGGQGGELTQAVPCMKQCGRRASAVRVSKYEEYEYEENEVYDCV